MSRLPKYLRLPLAVRFMTLEAAVLLIGAALALKLLPFRWLVRGGGLRLSQPHPGKQLSLPARHAGLPGQVGQAVQRAARHLPLDLLCLPQALAGQWMLRRRRIASTLHFGMAKSTEGASPMQAHAWLTVAGHGVIGIPASLGFTEVARFSREAFDDEIQ